MRGLLSVVLLLVLAPSLQAQEKDRPLERISIAAQQRPPLVIGTLPMEDDFPKKLGPFTLVQPVKRGEMIRLSLPVGEYVARAIDGIATANRRRKEAAVRRRIAEELKLLAEQRKKLAGRGLLGSRTEPNRT